jgi:hypothetical protein
VEAQAKQWTAHREGMLTVWDCGASWLKGSLKGRACIDAMRVFALMEYSGIPEEVLNFVASHLPSGDDGLGAYAHSIGFPDGAAFAGAGAGAAGRADPSVDFHWMRSDVYGHSVGASVLLTGRKRVCMCAFVSVCVWW